jgi:C-terminal processing protease CtpA/Prc
LGNSAALKLTTSRWITPNGRAVEKLEIMPDLAAVEPPTDLKDYATADDAQLAQALALLKTQR